MIAHSWWSAVRSWLGLVLLALMLNTDVTLRRYRSAVDAATSMSVSQCSTAAFDEKGHRLTSPKLTLRCPSGHVIHISRSFHGARRLPDVSVPAVGRPAVGMCSSKGVKNSIVGSRRCSYCEGDCVDESIGVVYDWSSSSCTGRETCSRGVLQSHMPNCLPPPLGGDSDVRLQSQSTVGANNGRGVSTSSSNHIAAPLEATRSHSAEVQRAPIVVRPAASMASATNNLHQEPDVTDRFSDYLQVDYDCVGRNTMIDVCGGGGARDSVTTRVVRGGGHLVSPGYLTEPVGSAYPSGVDCLCRLEMIGNRGASLPSSAAAGPKLHVAIFDMLLETKRGRCQADWVMIRLPSGEKHRHCGAISTGSKLVTSSNDAVEVQFHSDNVPDDNLTHSFSPLTSRPLKGFWFHFFAVPSDVTIQVTCHRLNASDSRVTEIRHDDVTSDVETGSDVTTAPSSSRLAFASDSSQQTGLFQVAPPNNSQQGSSSSTQRPPPRESRLSFFGFGSCSHDNASRFLIVLCVMKALVVYLW